ncbi:MATE efflux family protein [Treponema primitia ZAS-2]|uniref:Multidrug-efflux transporter n=1 Tax=Treponema primitia (strain ATCC BAA-887 / DSM 12427 / ZAS-2) TaxID=545694 RepID=F5YPD7_TREPZ|nr:MATE family efflux transporter [Treponema primitia]AEF86443.1 MATE efflux family protein [Treponema primitia ZAS-2]
MSNKKTSGTLTENIMGVMTENRLLLTLSIPMVISMTVQALYNIVDSIFVAQINENALTAVSLAFPVQNLMIAVSVGTGVGINAFLSRSLGEKNSDAANGSAVNGLFVIWLSSAVFIIAGIFFSQAYFRAQTDIQEIIEYGQDYMFIVCVFSLGIFNQVTLERLLSSTGKTFYAMCSQAAGAVINIILDPIMIFGLLGFPKMGVRGAAIATVIGQSLGALIALFFNLRVNHDIKLSFRKFRPNGRIIKAIYGVGIPAILMTAIGSIMTYGINKIVLPFTATAAAVFGVYFKLQSFVFMPIFGLSNAMVPIIAYNYGAKKKIRIIKTIRMSVIYATGIMLVGLVLFQLIPGPLLRMFNATEEMLAIGIPVLRIISLIFIFAGLCVVLNSVFQALGHGTESLIVSFARQLVILLPAAWLLSRTGSLAAVWWAFPISEIGSLVLSLIFMARIYSRKIKNIG